MLSPLEDDAALQRTRHSIFRFRRLVYPGTDDIQLLGANAFKKSLGGQVVNEFECEQVKTLKGWALLTAARLIDRAREFRQKKTQILDIRSDEATA